MSYSPLISFLFFLFCFMESLKEKLPFDDNFFDHVHMSQIAWGVPEHAVCDGLFALRRMFFF